MRIFIFLVAILTNYDAFSGLGFPDCSFDHCSQHRSQINQACVAAGMSGKPFPVVDNNGGVCTCSCSCVASKTRIRSRDGAQVAVRDLEIKDLVWAPLANEDVPIAKILRSSIKTGPAYVLLFSDGEELTASRNHTLVTTDDKIKSLSDLRVGDRIRGVDEKLKIVAKTQIRFTGFLYNLIINPQSDSARDHILVTENLLSGDWLLQSARDQIADEITLRSTFLTPFAIH